MALETRGLGFRYDKKAPWVFRGVDLRVEPGERVALVGPSGLGKSTLLGLLGGYLTPGEGEVLLDGAPLPQKGACPVQLIYQHPEKAVNPRWKMARVLEESGMLREEVLEALGIQRAWLGRYPGELSGGELQRFCVARALFPGVRYLLADEITAMLDGITQAQLWQFLLEECRRRGLGLVLVTHNQALARQVAGHILRLEDLAGPG